jgi:hypothetical protein
MTSPITTGGTSVGQVAPVPRYAFYGRVSTEDEQDPTLSFPRQLTNAQRLVADSGGRIVAHYYDRVRDALLRGSRFGERRWFQHRDPTRRWFAGLAR